MKTTVTRWKRKIRLFADEYPRTAWFLGLGFLGLVSFIASIMLEEVGTGQVQPFVETLGGVGVVLFVGLGFAAPVVLTHWLVTDPD